MNNFPKDTIAAVATPVGIGGISVIRISGPDSFDFSEKLFRGTKKVSEMSSHTIHHGTIYDRKGNMLDSVLISIFKSPHSYTGDDTCEINCHGGYFLSQLILSELYSIGVRPANPGEFTLRAVLNGKLDLAQAEAVADIILTKSEKSHRTSVEQLNGRLSKYTRNLRQEILDICSILELELDFSQEGMELVEKTIVIKKLDELREKIKNMISSYSNGKHIKEGVKVAIVGKPNAGKSSLMNLLLDEERAIVSHIPGTTRDTIDESIIIDGLEFIFTDTAGLRKSGDSIEQEGIRRTNEKVQTSDIVCLIVDSSIAVTIEDYLLYKKVENMINKTASMLFIFNKSDIKKGGFDNSFSNIDENKVSISCKTGNGISTLKKMLREMALPNYDSSESSIIVNNSRHKLAFENALTSIDESIQSLKKNMSDEFVAVDLRTAMDYLGEIIGLTTSEDILNNIFSKFCVGK